MVLCYVVFHRLQGVTWGVFVPVDYVPPCPGFQPWENCTWWWSWFKEPTMWIYIWIVSKWCTFARSTVPHTFALSWPIETVVNANWPLIHTGSIIPRTLALWPRYSPSSDSQMWTFLLRVSEQLETPQIVTLSWPFTYKWSHNCLCSPAQALNHWIQMNQRGWSLVWNCWFTWTISNISL